MRPFFSYYGSRWSVSKSYPPPSCDTVVEPFAGSAGYSTRFEPKRSILFDLNPDVCAVWRYLISATSQDVQAIPDFFDSIDEVNRLGDGERQLVMFWCNKGRAEVGTTLSTWYHKYKGSGDCKVWGPQVKRRLIEQMPLIREWEIHQEDYSSSIRFDPAHFHIDPPFSGGHGRRYRHSDLDYESLGRWCESIEGFAQVCEHAEASWLPFQIHGKSSTTRGKRDGSKFNEGIWTNRDMRVLANELDKLCNQQHQPAIGEKA